MRSISCEMPACISGCSCCVGMVGLLIGMKNIFGVQRGEELFACEEPEIWTSCSGSEKEKPNY